MELAVGAGEGDRRVRLQGKVWVWAGKKGGCFVAALLNLLVLVSRNSSGDWFFDVGSKNKAFYCYWMEKN